jgi:hypothetical protein
MQWSVGKFEDFETHFRIKLCFRLLKFGKKGRGGGGKKALTFPPTPHAHV